MKKANKVIVVIVFLLVILFGVGQFFASSLPAPANPSDENSATTPTQVIAYVPRELASSTPIKQGSCFANSVAAPYRSDAWRCTVGNTISDPCFAIPGSKNLLCEVDPAGISVSPEFVLQFTKPLPKAETPPGTIPSNWGWLVELSDGTFCSPFTGTLPFTATGEVARYGCAPGPLGDDALIFGDLNANASVWTATVGTLSSATSTFPPVITASATIQVAKVWQ